jgi:large subunit ribosomal protein L9
MPAGGNGRLYGAVTTQTVTDELAKAGFAIERKKVEIPGNYIKTAGKHKVTVKLYDNTTAELSVTVEAQQAKVEEKHAGTKRRPRRDETAAENETAEVAETEAVAENEPVAETEAVEAAETETVEAQTAEVVAVDESMAETTTAATEKTAEDSAEA